MRLIAAIVAGAAVAAGAQDAPTTTFRTRRVLDVASMDRTADACQDFYQFACGGWIKNNPIPPDQAKWSVYGKLYQDNQRFLWGILDSLAKQTSGATRRSRRSATTSPACMDEAAVEKLGARPLKSSLDRIARMTAKRELGRGAGAIAPGHGDAGTFFGAGSNQDFEVSTQVITFVVAGGLGLPDRDYYTKDDARSREIRDKYVAHVTRVFQLLGDRADVAAKNAATVMDVETALAKASLTARGQARPVQAFPQDGPKGLRALTPSLDWDAYLAGLGIAKVESFNVTEPEFFKAFERELGRAASGTSRPTCAGTRRRKPRRSCPRPS
jgi:endothelin-converting enzyme/putative endopeptidase